MINKQFSIHIRAPRNFVWHALWNDKNYRTWTKVFHEGSHYRGDLSEGSEVLFVDPDANGMYSIVEKNDQPSSIVFCHQGEIKEGKKESQGAWAGAIEAYYLSESDTGTDLRVEVQAVDEMVEFFADVFPRALDLVKSIAESDECGTVHIQTTVNASMEAVWKAWTNPEDIMQWNNASDDWYTPKAANDLRVGGDFTYTMAARDGSMSFDFSGRYTALEEHKHIAYTLYDQRKVRVEFKDNGTSVVVDEWFEAESMHPVDYQGKGWQAILDNFRKYVERAQ